MSQIGNSTLPEKQIQSCTEEEIIKLHMMSFVVFHISLSGEILLLVEKVIIND